jgi:acetaldehyde dehydrogenase (acetylating)
MDGLDDIDSVFDATPARAHVANAGELARTARSSWT